MFHIIIGEMDKEQQEAGESMLAIPVHECEVLEGSEYGGDVVTHNGGGLWGQGWCQAYVSCAVTFCQEWRQTEALCSIQN